MNTDQPHKTDGQPKESDILQNAEERRAPVFNPIGRVETIMADETKIADVRRHPFGLLLIYVQVFAALGLSLGLIFALLPGVLDALGLSDSGASSVASIFGFFTLSLGLIFLILVTRIYEGNQLIFTDKSVTQILQIGLFNRKVSELSMANVEDVTAKQSGIFPTLFNYGTLIVETAGEQTNFIFRYCPNPNAYAKALLDARHGFVGHSGDGH